MHDDPQSSIDLLFGAPEFGTTPEDDPAWREGDLVVIREGAAIPKFCAVCGHATLNEPQLIRLSFAPSKWYQPKFIKVLNDLAAKRATVFLCLCDAHRRKINSAVGLAVLLVCLAATLFLMSVWWDPILTVTAGGILFIIGIVVASGSAMPCHVEKIEAGRIFLAGLPLSILQRLRGR